jgi:hypothetical protein
MTTCRCPICGVKNAGRSSSNRLHARLGIGRDENNRSWNFGKDYKKESRLARRRLKARLMFDIEEAR